MGEERPFERALKAAIEKYHLGDIDTSLPELELLVKKHPDVAAVHGFLGGFLYLEGRYEDALPFAKRAAAISPRKTVPARLLILNLMKLGRNTEARSELLSSQKFLTDEIHREEWSELLDQVEHELRDFKEHD